MNKNFTKTLLLTGFSIIVAVFVLNTGAFAGRGCGYGNYGYRDNPDIKKERAAFLSETEELRENLFNKEQQLASEMDQKSPDIDAGPVREVLQPLLRDPICNGPGK